MSLGKANNLLRVTALLTSDAATRGALLAMLNETSEASEAALAGSVWASALRSDLQMLAITLSVCATPLYPDAPERYPLRAIALRTGDPLTRSILLQILGESEQQASSELADSCWADTVVVP